MNAAQAIVLLASTTVSADGVGPALDLGARGVGRVQDIDRATVRLTLTATSATGTAPTLDCTIETSQDPNAAEWTSVGAFGRLSAAGARDVEAVGVARYVRAQWALGGDAPGFTIAIAGRSVTTYVTRRDVEMLGVNADALAEVADEDFDAAGIAASREIDSLLWRLPSPLPERMITRDLVRDAAKVVAWNLLGVRGFDASGNVLVSTIETNYRMVVSRLSATDGGLLLAPRATGPATTDQPQIMTRARRGWGNARYP